MSIPEEPTPTPEEPALSFFLAIQTRGREHPAIVVEEFCVTAKMMGVLFRRVETLDVIQIGMQPFVRMRTDLDRPRLKRVLQRLVEVTARAVVYSTEDGEYNVKFPETQRGGRTVKLGGNMMHTVPRGPQALYKGPKIKRWEKQFSS